MKTISVIAVIAALGLLWAQEGPQGFGRGREGGGRPMSPVVNALDSNHDGTISGKEMSAAPAVLRKLDKNKDGALTAEEVRPEFGGRAGGGREGGAGGSNPDELLQTLMAFDKNKDGKLEKDEVPERMQGLFTRGDANKDGVLTQEEIRGMEQAQAVPQGGGRGEGRGEGRGGGMRMDPVMAALDADHDGTISADEIRNSTAALKTLDRNSDGQLTEDEIRPNFVRGRGFGGASPDEMAARVMERMDGNKDGRLSRDEMSEGPFAELFDRADSNKDGFVSQAELLAAIQQGGFGRGRGERRPE